MSVRWKSILGWLALLPVVWVIGCRTLDAEPTQVSTVFKVKGEASWRTSDHTNWTRVKAFDVIPEGATIQTADNSYIDLAVGVAINAVKSSGSSPPFGMIEISNSVRLLPNTTVKYSVLKLRRRDAVFPSHTATELRLVRGRILGQLKGVEETDRYEVTTAWGAVQPQPGVFLVDAEGVVGANHGSLIFIPTGKRDVVELTNGEVLNVNTGITSKIKQTSYHPTGVFGVPVNAQRLGQKKAPSGLAPRRVF